MLVQDSEDMHFYARVHVVHTLFVATQISGCNPWRHCTEMMLAHQLTETFSGLPPKDTLILTLKKRFVEEVAVFRLIKILMN